jgi:hypothetical protein
MGREAAPDRPRIAFDSSAILHLNAKVFKAHALTIEHAENVVVGNDEQRRRIGKRLVLRIPTRIRVPVRRDDGQIPNFRIEPAHHIAGSGLCWKKPVRMDQHSVLPWRSMQAIYHGLRTPNCQRP